MEIVSILEHELFSLCQILCCRFQRSQSHLKLSEQPSNRACSKSKYFRTGICRKIQSSNKNVWEKSRECCWFLLEATASAFSGVPHSGGCPGLVLLTHTPCIEEQNLQYWCGESTTTELRLDRMDTMGLPRSKMVTGIHLPRVSCMLQTWRRRFFLISGTCFNFYYTVFTTGTQLDDIQWTDLSSYTQIAPHITEGTDSSFYHLSIFYNHRKLCFCQQQLLQKTSYSRCV